MPRNFHQPVDTPSSQPGLRADGAAPSDKQHIDRELAGGLIRHPVRNCEECSRFSWFNGLPLMPMKHEFDNYARCAKGHRPRFIMPKHEYQLAPWGYRKACADFVKNSSVQGQTEYRSGRTLKRFVGHRPSMWAAALESQGNKCARCHKPLTLEKSAKSAGSFDVVCTRCFRNPPDVQIFTDELSNTVLSVGGEQKGPR